MLLAALQVLATEMARADARRESEYCSSISSRSSHIPNPIDSNPSWGCADDSLRYSMIQRLMISSGEIPNRAESILFTKVHLFATIVQDPYSLSFYQRNRTTSMPDIAGENLSFLRMTRCTVQTYPA